MDEFNEKAVTGQQPDLKNNESIDPAVQSSQNPQTSGPYVNVPHNAADYSGFGDGSQKTEGATGYGSGYQDNAETGGQTQQTPPDYSAGAGFPFGPSSVSGYTQPQNAINYSAVKPVYDYRPMSKGLKVFAVIMAAVILLTGASVAGYYIGRSSVITGGKDYSVNLAAKPADTDEMTAAQVYDKVDASIVGILVYNTAGAGAQASGVFYSEDGYIVTNDHIYSEVPSPKFKIYTSDGKEYSADFVAGDKVSDLAVLKINASGFQAAEFGDSYELVFGENVVAIGRPSDATDRSSITKGVISSTGRRVQNDTNYSSKLIQTDSAINPGSSGGALVNMYGQVVGITSSKIAGIDYDAVGYAIPTTTMKRIVEELINNGKVVSRAKLGITYTAIDSITAEINNLDYVGLKVASVAEDSDLYGKLKEGDIITHINGIEVTSDEIVLDIIEQSSAGDKITVTAVSGGKSVTYDAVLKANTSESSYTTGTENLPNGGSDDGTFDFPFGE